MTVYRRGGKLVYSNTRGADRTWEQPPGIGSVIEHERARHWTQRETDDFHTLLTSLMQRMDTRHRPDLAYAVELAGDRVATPARHAEPRDHRT